MGNEAIAMGAIAAGVNFVSGYPGTPSTEVLETVSKRRPDRTYVEWSVNEKAALETAAGGLFRSEMPGDDETGRLKRRLRPAHEP